MVAAQPHVEAGAAAPPPPAAMVSWLPHMTSFCCCLGLESGARTVGFLHLTVSLVLVTYCSYLSVQMATYAAADEEGVYATWHRIAVALTVLSTAHVVLAATLIYGVFKRNVLCLRAWVLVMLALLAAALLAEGASCAGWGLAGRGSEIFLAFAQALLFFCVVGYCILCINSYYMLVRSCEDMAGPKADF